MKRFVKVFVIIISILLVLFGVYFWFFQNYVIEIYPNFYETIFQNRAKNNLSFEKKLSMYNIHEIDINKVWQTNWDWNIVEFDFDGNYVTNEIIDEIYNKDYSDINYRQFKDNIDQILYKYNQENPENKLIQWDIIKLVNDGYYTVNFDYWNNYNSVFRMFVWNIDNEWFFDYIDAIFDVFGENWCIWLQDKFIFDNIWLPEIENNSEKNCNIAIKKYFYSPLFSNDGHYYIIAESWDNQSPVYSWMNLKLRVYDPSFGNSWDEIIES